VVGGSRVIGFGRSEIDDDDDDDDDVYLKKITTRASQNLILHRNADQPKA
jgi:hypothetical protein